VNYYLSAVYKPRGGHNFSRHDGVVGIDISRGRSGL
jgi:hypothetical protein